MVLWQGIAGVAGMTRRHGGLWRFLIARVRGRTTIELERERNRATVEAIRLLPGDCELLEYECNGRLRVIRKGPQPTVTAVEKLPDSGKLDQ